MSIRALCCLFMGHVQPGTELEDWSASHWVSRDVEQRRATYWCGRCRRMVSVSTEDPR